MKKQRKRQNVRGSLRSGIKKSFIYQTPLVLLFAALFVWGGGAKGSGQNLVISELMYDPKGVDTGQSDWIELYNNSDAEIILKKINFGLIDEEELKIGSSGKYLNCHGLSEDVVIESGKYFILANNTDDFRRNYADTTVNAGKVSFSLAGGGDTIRLSDDKCATFHATVSYDESWGASDNGKTLELLEMNEGYAEGNWQESFIERGTPGSKHSKYIAPEPEKPKIYPGGITITELFPNPFQSQYEEYVELYNGTSEDVDLLGWTLHDASKSGKHVFSESLILKARKYLAIFKKDFKFALNNSGDESVKLFDPNEKEVARAQYDGSKRNVSYNFDGSRWRWSKVLTPGSENILNNEPFGTVKIDRDVFADTYANFSVSTGDLDGDTVKVVWDFGDKHKSYLAKTRHKYLETGIYDGSVKMSDGSENVVKEFVVEVKDFPHPEIRIIAVDANPVGADTGVEHITIQNKSKKKINLNGWSIATGWKKFINHPIREDVIIKGKKEKQITSEVSSFSLNNTKAKIQLRYPDGKVAHEVKYKAPNKSIADGEKYVKVKGGWEWIRSQKSTKSIKSIKQEEEAILSPVIGNQPALSADWSSETLNADEHNIKENRLENNVVPVVIERENKLLAKGNKDVKIDLLKRTPRVLGAETVREIDGIYFLTPQSVKREHYASVFFKNGWSDFNLKLNTLLNFFSN